MSTYQIISIRPNLSESIVAVISFAGTAQEALEAWKERTPTMRDNSYKAVRV